MSLCFLKLSCFDWLLLIRERMELDLRLSMRRPELVLQARVGDSRTRSQQILRRVTGALEDMYSRFERALTDGPDESRCWPFFRTSREENTEVIFEHSLLRNQKIN